MQMQIRVSRGSEGWEEADGGGESRGERRDSERERERDTWE